MAEPLRLDATCAEPGCRAPRDRLLALRLLVTLTALAAALKLFGFRRTYATLQSASAGGARTRHGAGRTPQHIAAVVVHVNRHVLPFRSRCLLESLTLWYLLRRCGHAAELLLGARALLGPFAAHAWVELAGAVLNDDPGVRDIYPPFDMSSLRSGQPSRWPR